MFVFLFMYIIFFFLLYLIPLFFRLPNDVHIIFHFALAQVGRPLEKTAAGVYVAGCVGITIGANDK